MRSTEAMASQRCADLVGSVVQLAMDAMHPARSIVNREMGLASSREHAGTCEILALTYRICLWNLMKHVIRRIRNNSVVLAILVRCLKGARSLGLLRSRRFYSHVPYRGVVSVNCGDGKTFLIKSHGHNIENGLFWEGLYGHEPETMRLWVHASTASRFVLDIGANSGVFALSAAAVGAKFVHAFEPVARVNAILRENFALNPDLDLHAWPHAVGSSDGTATLYDPGGDAPTSASLSSEFAHSNFENLVGRQVEVVSIDSFCQKHRIDHIDLIKIDVEGFEEAVLLGMQDVVRRCLPTIFMEVLEGRAKSLQALVQSLWPDSYEWCAIDEGEGHVSRNVMLQPRSTAAKSNS